MNFDSMTKTRNECEVCETVFVIFVIVVSLVSIFFCNVLVSIQLELMRSQISQNNMKINEIIKYMNITNL